MKIQCTLDQPLVMDCDCPSGRGTEKNHIHNLTPEKQVHYLHKKRNTEAKHKQIVCDDQFGKDYIYLVCQKNRNKKFVERILSPSGSEQTGLLMYSSWFQPCLTLYITAHSCCCWSLLYSAILRSRADPLCSCRVWFWTFLCVVQAVISASRLQLAQLEIAIRNGEYYF